MKNFKTSHDLVNALYENADEYEAGELDRQLRRCGFFVDCEACGPGAHPFDEVCEEGNPILRWHQLYNRG